MKSLHRSMLLSASFAAFTAFNATAQLDPQLENTTYYSSGSSQTNQFNINDGYIASGSSLDGQPLSAPNQWQTTDPYNSGTGLGSTSLVDWTVGYTPLLIGDNNNSVLFGGYGLDYPPGFEIFPGSVNPSLYYSFTNSGVFASPSLLRSAQFSVDFSIVGPSATVNSYTNKDYFGFNLLDASGANSLAQFRFNPFTASIGNNLEFDWIRNGTNVVADGITFNAFEIEYNALYRLTATITNIGGVGPSVLNLSISGLDPQSGVNGVTNYAVVTNQNIINGGALSGAYTISDFGRVSLDWELSSGSALTPGGNYMIMTASSIISQAVPEPGTWAAGVLLLSAVVYVMSRRRAAANAGTH